MYEKQQTNFIGFACSCNGCKCFYCDSVMTAALDAMFKGSFYIKEDDDDNPKSVLIKLNTKTGEVKLLMSADEKITDEHTTAGKEIVSDNSVSGNNISKLEQLNKKLEEFKSLNDEKITEDSTEKYAELVSMLNDITDTDPSFGDIYDKLINEETLNKMKSFVLCTVYMATADRGFDLYTIDEGLHLGTANTFYGTQIWKVVDESGSAVILKNNVPRYLIVEFSQAENEEFANDEDVMSISKRLIEKNKEAYFSVSKKKND